MGLDDLRSILIACAGDDDTEALRGDILDSALEDLGYDSLAIMETAARIQLDHGIDIPDGRISEVRTVRELLDLIHQEMMRS